MSRKEIYQALRSGGLSRAGALGMMGNIGAESAFVSNIVESRCPMSGWDYTHNVNIGAISPESFACDSYGYGLCQWTLPYRKRKLWNFAYTANESIGDENMQVQFILRELKTEGEYDSLYNFLCETEDMYEATKRICLTYERPAVNNIDVRYQIACRCANEAYDDPDQQEPDDGCGDDSCPIDPVVPPPDPSIESCEITVRVLREGMTGRDVFVMQTAITDMGCNCGVPDGDFGPQTLSGVKDFQHGCNLEITGIVGQAEWQIIFQ